MSTIHDRLAEVRAESRLALRPFADQITAAGRPVSQQGVANYEKGKNGGSESVPVEYVATVCKAFGLRVEWLVLGEEPRHPLPIPIEVQGFRDMAAIADRIRSGLDDEESTDDIDPQGPEERTG